MHRDGSALSVRPRGFGREVAGRYVVVVRDDVSPSTDAWSRLPSPRASTSVVRQASASQAPERLSRAPTCCEPDARDLFRVRLSGRAVSEASLLHQPGYYAAQSPVPRRRDPAAVRMRRQSAVVLSVLATVVLVACGSAGRQRIPNPDRQKGLCRRLVGPRGSTDRCPDDRCPFVRTRPCRRQDASLGPYRRQSRWLPTRWC